MAMHGMINKFDLSHETWATYVELLEFFFIANGIEDPEKNMAVLLTAAPPQHTSDLELVASQKTGREIV